MIKHPEFLSVKDKLFMLTNKKCFTNSTRTAINFNSEEWMSMIENTVPPETIAAMEKLPNHTKSRLLTIMPNVSKPEMVEKFVDSLCNDVVLETSEGIRNFLSFAHTNIVNISKKCKLNPDQISNMYGALITVYIPWKITANSIMKKASTEISASDKKLSDYLTNINKILFQELGVVKEPVASAVLIHYLMDNLDIDIKNNQCIDFFLDCKKYYNNESSSSIHSILKKLADGKVDALNVIDRVSTVELGNYGDKLLEFSKRKMEENFIKNKICKEVNNESLCIGDDVFPDHEPINVGNLLIELDKLSDEEIKNYIGEDKTVIYTLDENDIGYIKNSLKAPLCKVLRKGERFNTLAKIHDISVLLFKVYGDNTIYGISFPPSNGGIRKLIQVTVPAGKDFTM